MLHISDRREQNVTKLAYLPHRIPPAVALPLQLRLYKSPLFYSLTDAGSLLTKPRYCILVFSFMHLPGDRAGTFMTIYEPFLTSYMGVNIDMVLEDFFRNFLDLALR